MSINCFVGLIKNELLKEISIRSEDESEPVVVKDIPRLWKCLGKVIMPRYSCTKEYKRLVVKVYAREGEGIEKSQKYTAESETILLIQSLFIKEKIS